MVREENVKLMSKIAIYEKQKGKTEIPMNKFYKEDYIRLNTLKTVMCATLVYVLIVAILVAYNIDFVLANILKMDYKQLAIILLGIYGIWIMLYWLLARIFYGKKFEASESNIVIYKHEVKKLQEAAKKETIKTTGGVGIGDDFIEF